MSLKKEFRYLVIALAFGLAAMLGVLIWAAQTLSASQLARERAYAVKDHSAAFSSLALEVLQSPSAQVLPQWRQEHQRMAESLAAFDTSSDGAPIKELRLLNASLEETLAEMILPGGEVSPDLMPQLVAKVQKIQRLSDSLNEAADQAHASAEQVLRNSIWLVMCIIGLIVTGALLYFRARILRPIQRLTEDLSASGPDRPMDVSTWPADNEFGTLAHEFAAMQLRVAVAVAEANAVALRLSRSNRSLEDFASIASHDLKEPLRAIQNQAAMLAEDGAGRFGPDDDRRITRISELAVRAQRLVSDLLDLSRSATAADEQTASTDPAEIIEEIGISLREMIADRNGRIEVASGLPPVPMNRSEALAVFSNLVTNGLKYNDRADKKIEIGCAFDDQLKGPVFYVRDDGIGIDTQHREKVFQMFRRLRPEREEDGTGAGLALVRSMIQGHGGDIWCESEPGKGSTFYFNFPEAAR